jgi:serine/threonine protein kinase
MFQLLTGRLPFQADNQFNMVYQIMHGDFPKPSSLRKELPPVLDDIIGKATTRDREARYQTWEEFSQDLTVAVRSRQLLMPKAEFAATEKFDILRALPFFADFSDVEIWEALRFSDWRRIPPESVIMRDGEPGDFFCFVADGQLKVSKGGKILSTLSKGACFGEMAVINRRTQLRGADVSAITPSDIITIRGEALQQASESCRMHFYQGFLSVLAARLSVANQRLSDL